MSFLHLRTEAWPGEVIKAASVLWFRVPETEMSHRECDVE